MRFSLNLFQLKNISFAIIIFSLSACQNSEYPGFKKGEGNIYFKLISIGENETKPQPGDYVTVDLVYKTLADSIFFKGTRKFKLTEPKEESSIDYCFLTLAEKDKASFIISADVFFNQTLKTSLPGFLNQGEQMKVVIDMIDIQSEEEYLKEKSAFLAWVEDFGEYEKLLLKQYIDGSQLDLQATEEGIYHIMLKKGNGVKVANGDTLKVDFEGKFLNGKFFDSTKKRKEPFQFIYGQQWQVVKGLEKAIGMMEEGEKSIFILPSEMAFGKKGSSTGIIPPFTSLIFEVELQSLKKGKQ